MQKPGGNMEETIEKPSITSENPNKTPRNLGGRPKKTALSEKQRKELEVYKSALSYKNIVGEDITISGLAQHLGFLDTRDIIEAAMKGDRGVRKALALCEEKYEKLLAGKNSAGATVALKQLGWREIQYIQQENKSVSVQINLTASLDDLSKMLNPIVEVPAV